MKKEIIIIFLLLLISPVIYAFDVSVKYSDIVCSPNELLCNNDDNTKVFKCGQYGNELSVIKSCDWNQICSMNSTGQIGCIPDYRVKAEFNKGIIYGVFFSLIIFLIILIIYFLKKEHKNKRH